MTARIVHPRPRLAPGPIAKHKGAKSGLTPRAREILDRMKAIARARQWWLGRRKTKP
ncbi:MAG TPA: hypothetical protein VLN57_21020 [Xanthobacteraceae bacterium]|nr:hypothetical protein [Xanthobacteraceae bacterium]